MTTPPDKPPEPDFAAYRKRGERIVKGFTKAEIVADVRPQLIDDIAEHIRRAVEEAAGQRAALEAALREALDDIQRGRIGSFGTWRGYTPQINVEAVKRWRTILRTSEKRGG